MKKIIIIVFLYVMVAFATGMSIDNGELAINTPTDKAPAKKAVKITANSIGEVDFRLGEISVKHKGSKENEDIDEEDKIFELDTLITGEESKCEIILNDGSTIRISEKSKYVFESYSDKPNIAFVGNLIHGETWTNVNRSDKNSRDFKVKSPIAVAA
ncbi:MAG: hypothetical protein GQ534_07265, partial [Candidatus Delongbacteria bacterium]|nr:hypothetical protein [Candidatus Delongbacteria bacterium]